MRLLTFIAALLALLFAGASARAEKAETPAETPAKAALEAEPEPGMGLAALGGYQRQALNQALAGRGLELDPNPEGKRVGLILVKNFDVFDPEDGYLVAWLNNFHMTTREHIIAREVLLRPGDVWSWTIAEETRRRLADPMFTSFVVVVPVRSATLGEVNVLVVTRDLFSLRLNTVFEYQAGVLSLLHVEPAENNFLGRRKGISARFEMDLGRYFVGPTYVDSNIVGSRWRFDTVAQLIIGRDSGQTEGSFSETKLKYPLWAFSRKWGAAFSASHFVGTQRSFRGPNLRLYDDPQTAAEEAVPWQYRQRTFSGTAQVMRQMGTRVMQEFGAGYRFDLRRAEVFDDVFAGSAEIESAFRRDVLPRSERVSSPFLTYKVFTPRFVTFRDLHTFDLPEDIMMGPSLGLSAAWSLPELGSDVRFVGLTAKAIFTGEIGQRGLLSLAGEGSTRINASDWLDNRVQASVFFASPQVAKLARLVVYLVADRLTDNLSVRNLVIGGDTGLRGYAIGAFQGQARASGNVEIRSSALKILFTRLGGTLFWDFGHVARRFDELIIHHNLGAGFRLLIPQLQATVIRFDWAFATQGRSAGFPGRITAGFTQAFN